MGCVLAGWERPSRPRPRVEEELPVQRGVFRPLRPSRPRSSRIRSPSFFGTVVDPERLPSFAQDAQSPSDSEDDRVVWSLVRRSSVSSEIQVLVYLSLVAEP